MSKIKKDTKALNNWIMAFENKVLENKEWANSFAYYYMDREIDEEGEEGIERIKEQREEELEKSRIVMTS